MGAGRAAVLAALALLAVADPAPAQVFFASRPHPEFEVGPLFVRARVGPTLGPTPVDLLWSLVVPPTRSGAALQQDLYLLWPGEVVPEPDLGPTDPALVRAVEEATWAERTFWGERHRLTLSFGDVRARAMFPLYFRYRDRALRLSEDPSQLTVAFSQADRLRIEEMTPPAARRQRSETLENTEVVSVFLDRGEGLRPQTLTVQFGYFWGLQSWAPVLFAVLFFTLGNLAGPLLRGLFTWVVRTAGARLHFGRRDEVRPRSTGVVLPPETLARIVPGQTTHEQVLAICGRHPEEHERLGDPEWRSLVYRGRRAVPRRRRTFGWLSTVDGWDVEHHEVEIELHRGVVRDIQARVRRTHPARPDAG